MAESESSSGGAIAGVVISILIVAGIVSASSHTPVVTTEDLNVTTSIPYESESRWDDSVDLGESEITQAGVDGENISTYRITLTDDEETSREKVADWVDTQPVTEVTTYGTYVEPVYTSSNYYDYNSAGCLKDQWVNGYFRSNGTYVSGYYRNSPSDNCY